MCLKGVFFGLFQDFGAAALFSELSEAVLGLSLVFSVDLAVQPQQPGQLSEWSGLRPENLPSLPHEAPLFLKSVSYHPPPLSTKEALVTALRRLASAPHCGQMSGAAAPTFCMSSILE